jgi:hypothetical protein
MNIAQCGPQTIQYIVQPFDVTSRLAVIFCNVYCTVLLTVNEVPRGLHLAAVNVVAPIQVSASSDP